MTSTEIQVLRAQMAASIYGASSNKTAARAIAEAETLISLCHITTDEPAPSGPAKPKPLPIGMRHLGIVREFIQHKAINGDRVEWGSDDPLQLQNVTVLDMETLATQIALDAYQNKPAATEPDYRELLRNLVEAVECLPFPEVWLAYKAAVAAVRQ